MTFTFSCKTLKTQNCDTIRQKYFRGSQFTVQQQKNIKKEDREWTFSNMLESHWNLSRIKGHHSISNQVIRLPDAGRALTIARWVILYYLYSTWKTWICLHFSDLPLLLCAVLTSYTLPFFDNCQNWGQHHILKYRKFELPFSFVPMLLSVLWFDLWRMAYFK